VGFELTTLDPTSDIVTLNYEHAVYRRSFKFQLTVPNLEE